MSRTWHDVLDKYKDTLNFENVTVVSVDQIGELGDALLHMAAREGNVEDIDILLVSRADINLRGDMDNTALHEAVGNKHYDAVRKLLELGADPTAVNGFGLSPGEKIEDGSDNAMEQIFKNSAR